jgi:hypothetical protein
MKTTVCLSFEDYLYILWYQLHRKQELVVHEQVSRGGKLLKVNYGDGEEGWTRAIGGGRDSLGIVPQ